MKKIKINCNKKGGYFLICGLVLQFAAISIILFGVLNIVQPKRKDKGIKKFYF